MGKSIPQALYIRFKMMLLQRGLSLNKVAKKYGLNDDNLNSILWFRAKGYNNTRVAKKAKVHRITVQRYLKKIQRMNDTELLYVLRTIKRPN